VINLDRRRRDDPDDAGDHREKRQEKVGELVGAGTERWA